VEFYDIKIVIRLCGRSLTAGCATWEDNSADTNNFPRATWWNLFESLIHTNIGYISLKRLFTVKSIFRGGNDTEEGFPL